ncbi:hypothetical protein Esti_006419 [Eimeria stiedai]
MSNNTTGMVECAKGRALNCLDVTRSRRDLNTRDFFSASVFIQSSKALREGPLLLPGAETERRTTDSNSSRPGPAERGTLETGEARTSCRDVGKAQPLPTLEGTESGRLTRANKKKQRAFDWSRAQFQRVLLKIAYNGENFAGLAAQAEDSGIPTIEDALFKAMERACLIPNRSACNLSRCGRTDKGVHAAGNYISLNLRVKCLKLVKRSAGCKVYVSLLNRLLPLDIRVLAATLVPQTFDARFDCLYRVYKYFFATDGLDIKLMQNAAKLFVGSHNFLRFCKVDRKQGRSLRRRIIRFEVQPESSGFAVATIVGVSFLWHQIRFMVAALMDVGSGLRSEASISSLLKEGSDSEAQHMDASTEGAGAHSASTALCAAEEDLQKRKSGSRSELPVRPAPADNLVLYDCCFEGLYFHRTGVFNRLFRTESDFARFKSEALGPIERPPNPQPVPCAEDEKPVVQHAGEEAAAPEAGDEQPSCHLPRCTEESRSFQVSSSRVS